jgi:hypothetical protein
MRTLERPDRFLDTIRWLLYLLAAAVLVVGLYGAISLFTVATSLEGIMALAGIVLPGAIASMISTAIAQAATASGLVVLGLTLFLAGLLYSSGKLLARTIVLEMRVRRLEFAMTEHATLGHLPPAEQKP